MRFTIRDLLLITFSAAVCLGWLVDHWRLAARDAEWEERFAESMRLLSRDSQGEYFFDTPGGPYSVNRKPDPENRITMP